jgi:hypothetical protein
MQTFLPYPNFEKSAQVLDYRRLGKQRVEALQVLKAIKYDNYGWSKHPIVKMWNGFENALIEYKNSMIKEWINRGYKNNMDIEKIKDKIIYPTWLGDEALHASHRSNLLKKDYKYYSQFNWEEKPGIEYIWIIPEKLK